MKPGRFANSAPLIPSSTKTSQTVHPFFTAKARAFSTWRVTDFISSATFCSVDFRL